MMVFICAIAREFRIGAEPNLRFSLSLGFARRR